MYALTLLFLTITASPEPYSAPLNDPPAEEEQRPCEEVQDAQEDVESLKRAMLGLEFYLLDKKDYKSFCPYLEWEQPSLEEYKKEPKSYLPESCKTEKI